MSKSTETIVIDDDPIFEEVVIKGEIHDSTNTLKSVDKIDNTKLVGEAHHSIPVCYGTSSSFVSNSKCVFMIKNLSGKSVALRPKSTPVVIKQEHKVNNDFNMPSFSKLLQVLNGNSSKKIDLTEKDKKYSDSQTQTDLVVYQNKEVQTDNYMPSPAVSVTDDLPNITNLIEYVCNTPKYSSGLDEINKSDLIDMSKNIAMKSQMMNKQNKTEESLKKQLFFDLRDCATFDFLGNKPIHNAVIENDLSNLKRQIFALRLRKISIDIENNQGQTPLQLSVIHNGNMEIITMLLQNQADVLALDQDGNSLLHLAVVNSTYHVLQLLLQFCPAKETEINRKNDEGLTPLMLAAINSNPDMVDTLLRNKADPNLRDEKSGRTALFHAVELNCNNVINLLLKYRADPKVRNYFGLTALDAARDLDIQDSKLLETDNQSSNSSVIVSLNETNKISESSLKRGAKQNGESAKKSKLSFVPALKKVELSEINKNKGKKRKK